MKIRDGLGAGVRLAYPGAGDGGRQPDLRDNEIRGQTGNGIEVLVARLRRKLGADAVKTKRGYGYFMGDLDERAP